MFHQPLFEPAARQMQHRTLARQTLAEFRHERTGDGKIGFRHVRHHHHEVRRILFRHLLQTIHPQVRQIAILPGDGQPGGDALEIFNQPQAQHDGNGPQLAQFQGTHRLVSGDEGAERSRINLRIHMRDQFEHDVIDARKSGGRAVQEAGQLPAVAPGQMPPGQLNLLFDQVEVVEKPFGGGGDAPAWIYGQGRAIEGSEDVLVLAQPGQQTVGTPPGDHLVTGRESLGMARQLFDAEQLGPQRRLARAWARTLMRRPSSFESAMAESACCSHSR